MGFDRFVKVHHHWIAGRNGRLLVIARSRRLLGRRRGLRRRIGMLDIAALASVVGPPGGSTGAHGFAEFIDGHFAGDDSLELILGGGEALVHELHVFVVDFFLFVVEDAAPFAVAVEDDALGFFVDGRGAFSPFHEFVRGHVGAGADVEHAVDKFVNRVAMNGHELFGLLSEHLLGVLGLLVVEVVLSREEIGIGLDHEVDVEEGRPTALLAGGFFLTPGRLGSKRDEECDQRDESQGERRNAATCESWPKDPTERSAQRMGVHSEISKWDRACLTSGVVWGGDGFSCAAIASCAVAARIESPSFHRYYMRAGIASCTSQRGIHGHKYLWNKMLTSPRLCIFDLDGTLVDSLRDIGESVNAALELLGLPPRDIEDYRFLVGEGVPVLCQRAIGETHPHLVERLSELARSIYRVRLIVHTKPYEGIAGLIHDLQGRGIRLAVLSNKPHDSTKRIVDAFWPAGTFRPVYGYLHYDLRKPNPLFARLICEQDNVSPRDTWFIGDTPTDIETSRRLGSTCISVTWGFRPREELSAAGATTLVDRPEQIAELAAQCAR